MFANIKKIYWKHALWAYTLMLGHHIEFEYCVEQRMARCAFRIITFMGRWSPKWPKVVVFPFIFKLSHPVACCRRLAVRVKVFCDAKPLFFW